jgi:hypothetical protein
VDVQVVDQGCERLERVEVVHAAKAGHDVGVAEIEQPADVRMADLRHFPREAHRVGGIGQGVLDEQGLDRDPDPVARGELAHLEQRVAFDAMQALEVWRRPGRHYARVMHHHARADCARQLEHRPADGLVQLEVRLVHEVYREDAVHRVLERAARADLLQPAQVLGQDPPAGDQVKLVERQLAVASAGGLDPRDLIVQVRQIGQRLVGREPETGNHVRSVCHGSSSARRVGRARPEAPRVTVLGRA